MSFFNKLLLLNSSPNSKRLKEYKKTLKSLNQIQWETSIGLMLGDASIQTQNKGKTYRLKFEWSDKNKPYLDHVYNLFDEWVISFPHKKSRFSPKGNLVVTWGFQTISHEAFNPLAELFIINNKKSIKDLLIKDYLTARGLAYWFMDDGGKLDYNKNSKNKSLVLNTQSFTELEVIKLASELTDKFKLSIHIRTNKGKKIIVINSESFILFRELIDPYIIPQMRSKLPIL
jgi:hypothetical protein